MQTTKENLTRNLQQGVNKFDQDNQKYYYFSSFKQVIHVVQKGF